MNQKEILKKLLDENKIDHDQFKQLTRLPRAATLLVALSIVLGLALGITLQKMSPKSPEIREIIKKVVEVVTPEPGLEISYFYPQNETNEVTEIYAVFNRPMVKPDDLDKIITSLPLTMEPAVMPSFIWAGTNRLKIATGRNLEPGTRYTVSFPPQLTDLTGLNLGETVSFSFLYKPLKLERVYYENYSSRGYEFTVVFNAAVNSDKLKGYLAVVDAEYTPLKYEMVYSNYNSTHQRLVMPEQSVSGIDLRFVVKQGLTTALGNAPTAKDLEFDWAQAGSLNVESIEVNTEEEQPEIEISLSHNFDDVEKMKAFIQVDHLAAGDQQLTIRKKSWGRLGITSPNYHFGDTHTVTLRQGLTADVYTLADDYQEVIEIPDASAAVNIRTGGIFQSENGELVVPLDHINTDTMYLTVYQLHDNNLPYFATIYDYSTRDQELFYKLAEVKYVFHTPKNKRQTEYLDLKSLVGDKLSGPKILKFSYDGSYRTDERLLLLTDLGISCKRIDNSVAILAASLKNGKPLADVDAAVYSRSNQVIARGKTDASGVIIFNNLDYQAGVPDVVIARSDADVNYLHLSRGHVPTVGFKIDGDKYTAAKDIEAFVYGEREIYRPGEEVNLKIIARGRDFANIPNLPLELSIVAPDGSKAAEASLKLNDLSTAEYKFQSRPEGTTGYYHVTIRIPGQQIVIGTGKVQIEDFIPDRIETKVSVSKKTLTSGDRVELAVTGKYLFGKPASGNKVKAVYSIVAKPWTSAKYPDYTYGDNRIEFKEIFQELKEEKLDEKGAYTYLVPVPENLRPASGLEMILTATVLDVGSRGVSSRESVLIHPYPYYLGIKSQTGNTRDAKVGETLSFKIAGVLPDDTLIQDRKLQVTVYRLDWQYSMRQDNEGRYRYFWDRKESLFSRTELALQNGIGAYDFKVTDWGEYILEVKDPQLNVIASLPFECGWWWDGGHDATGKMDFDRIEITTDKEKYFPGETARIKLKTTFDGEAYVFIENDKIRYDRRLTVKNRAAEFTVNIGKDHVPNMYVSVIQLQGTATAKFGNYRAFGVQPVTVIQKDRILKATIDAPALKVGQEQEITVSVKDSDGRPVDGEVSLSIVDKGVLQLSRLVYGDPYDFFYRKRGNFVLNSDIYSYINGEPDTKVSRKLTPSSDMDDAASRHRSPIRIREEKPVSYWYPRLIVRNGIATVKFPSPQFSGSLVMRATAITRDGVGFVKTEKEIKEPVILEAVLPRALAPGDVFEFPVTLTSNIDQEINTNLNLTIDGPIKLTANREPVKIPGQGKITKVFTGTADQYLAVARMCISVDVGAVREPPLRLIKEYEIPVRPPYPLLTKTYHYVVAAGVSSKNPVEDIFLAGTGHYRYAFSKLPSLRLLNGLQYLIRYPYGCVEQTTSSVFPQLYLKKLLGMVKPELKQDASIDANINAGIRRLLTMHLTDGSFTYWPGGTEPYPYGTVYAANFLFEAKKAGYPVPDRSIEKLKTYLQSLLQSDQDDSLRAYAGYVLALSGTYNVALAKKLMDKLDGFTQYYAVATIAMSGDLNTVKDYIYARSPNMGKVRRNTYGYLSSNVIAEAVVLNALVDIDVKLPAVESLVAALLTQAKYNGHWGSTHDNGQVLVALGKYFSRKEYVKPDFSGTLSIGGKDVFTFSSAEDVSFSVKEKHSGFQIRSEGSGEIFVTLVAEGIPAPNFQQEMSKGIKLTHAVFDLNGNQIKKMEFNQGDLYIIQAEMEIAENVGNLYLEDLMPGGFEIENTRLASRSGDIPFLTQETLKPEHMDIQSDRLVVFFNSLDGNTRYRYRYLVRAVTKGEFTSPASSSGCMYNPDLMALTFNPTITVR